MQTSNLLTTLESDGRDFMEALKIQGRVIKAMILREIRTRFWQSRIGYFWAIIDPCIHVGVWFVILIELRGESNKAPVHSVGPLLFLASGILPFFMFIKTSKYLSKAISSNSALMTHPIVKFIDIIFARFILEGCTQVVVAIIVLSGLVITGYAPLPHNPLGLFLPTGLLLLAGLGFGTINATFCALSVLYRDFLGLSQRLLYFTSGVFFLGDSLPSNFIYWMSFNPVFHGVELFRSAYFADYTSSWANPWYLFSWGIGMFFMGLCFEHGFRAKLKEN